MCQLSFSISISRSEAKIVYERLINITADPGIKEALGFLMTREIAHQKSFEKALYAIESNFPPGKMPGVPEFTDKYYHLSTGNGEAMPGSWNSGPQWETLDDPEEMVAVGGGDGTASVKLDRKSEKLIKDAATRTASHPESDPITGADLGAGPGAGAMTLQ